MKQVLILMMYAWLISSCIQEDELKTFSVSEIEQERRNDEFITIDGEEGGNLHEYDTEVTTRSAGTVYYNVPPYQGCPSETVYPFIVKDWGEEESVSLKLISPQGNPYYIPLLRTGIYQYRFLTIHTAGRWEWKYVFTDTHQPTQPGYGYYYKDNTNVSLESDGSVSIVWPFEGTACWTQTCGPGCGAHTHANGEYYAQDWACSNGSLGKPLYSPLDGVITKVSYAPTTYGNYVDVQQHIGTETVKFRIAHLSSVGVSQGDVVFSGSSILGEIGSTGNSTGPHAHCVMYNITGVQESIPFTLNALCE